MFAYENESFTKHIMGMKEDESKMWGFQPFPQNVS
jgi:hypothetical protein